MRTHTYIAFLLLCLFWACTKDNEFSGPPVIKTVSLLDSARQDSSFARALPGTLVLISGENLGGATQIYFNGQSAYFNPTYNTNTHIIITIPDNAPSEATDPDVPNQIRIVTSHGEAVFAFVVDIPPPNIEELSNENALPGDSLIIWGSSLWLIEKVVFPGGREVTALKESPDGYRIGLIMPNLGNDTGRIVVHAKYGVTAFNAPLNDHESANLLSNLTDNGETGEKSVFNWAYWGANRTGDATMFPGTRGHYLQNIFGGVGAKNGAWWEGNRSGNFSDVARFTAADLTQQASNYALKFEVNTKEPWTAAICVLRFGETYAYRLMPFSNAPDKSFETGNKWQTITVPLSDFKKAADGVEGTGAGAATLSDLVKADGKVAFGYRFITEDAPVEVFNAAFDNFRIVKIR